MYLLDEMPEEEPDQHPLRNLILFLTTGAAMFAFGLFVVLTVFAGMFDVSVLKFYPLMAGLGAVVGFSWWWGYEYGPSNPFHERRTASPQLFPRCPDCGRRSGVKLVGKKRLGERKETVVRKETSVGGGSVAGYGYSTTSPKIVHVDTPVTISVKEFEYTYRCKSCGHTWSEIAA